MHPDYANWPEPVDAIRHALSVDPRRVEKGRDEWAGWLRDRGVTTSWLPRLSIDDLGTGELTITEDAYEFPAPIATVYSDVDDDRGDAPLLLACDGERHWTTHDAVVVGGWDVVTTPDGACWPALTPRDESVLVSNGLGMRLVGWTPSLMIVRDFGVSPRRQLLRSLRPRTRSRIDRAISLVGEHSYQYGHWMIDYLPRSLAVRALPASTPVLIDADVPQNSLWWLESVVPGHPVIRVDRGEAVEVGTLFVPLQRTFCPTGWIESMELTPDVFSLDPRAVTQIQRLAATDVAASTRHRRLWLGRRGGHHALLNEDDLLNGLAPHGFEAVYLEDLSMQEVQRLLAETRDIIAPAGSQVLNVMAAPPGLRMLVLIGHDVTRARGNYLSYPKTCGHEVAVVGGTRVGLPGRNSYEDQQRPYVVSPDVLERAFLDFLELD